MSCCKHAPGGICDHDRANHKERANMERAQIMHDMSRPGICDYELDQLKKKLANVNDKLPDITTTPICPNCKKFLAKGASHESSAGGYDYYTCK